ncbi:MAG: hypothetical protein JNK87_38640 [Bryobacterales bacterium]|nr:hypothetical protein [Bryobacterales bacterium]
MSLEERLDSLALNLEMLKKDVDLARARMQRRSEKMQWLRSCAHELRIGTVGLREDSMALRNGADRARVRMESMRQVRRAGLTESGRSPSRAPGQAAAWDSAVYTTLAPAAEAATPARASRQAGRKSLALAVEMSNSI